MSESNEKLISWLFETKALRVCPPDKPFWYTSGTIGPYYINTHFLYGSEEKANELLKLIDKEKGNIYACPEKVLKAVRDNYRTDSIFKGLIDEMCRFIKDSIDISQVDCISGGERRDWFFSFLIAEMLAKPHITIYKDMTCIISQAEGIKPQDDFKGKNILHVADLITEASSYERAWIPAIENKGGKIKWSVVVVDRKQGGGELLAKKGIVSHAMASIDKSTFNKALLLNHINKEQHEMIMNYIDNPKQSMRKFFQNHPEFLENSLKSDEKTKERAKLCLEKNIYDL